MRGVGGLYEVLLTGSSCRVPARARGELRHAGLSPLVGDEVEVLLTEKGNKTETFAAIERVLPRKNALIRPPFANLDVLFLAVAASHPAPDLSTVDKLLSIAEHEKIEPVLIIGKKDLDEEAAERLAALYRAAGFTVFVLSAKGGEGLSPLQAYIGENLIGKTAAFAGASGVGKSTLMNALFPDLLLETGEISRKIERGKHTTRRVELYPVPGLTDAFIADTPGFSMLDFVRFDFFPLSDLFSTMREFRPFAGACRYTKCTHTKEEGCAVLEAVRQGKIAPSRHQSYLLMYAALKDKHEWSRKK